MRSWLETSQVSGMAENHCLGGSPRNAPAPAPIVLLRKPLTPEGVRQNRLKADYSRMM